MKRINLILICVTIIVSTFCFIANAEEDIRVLLNNTELTFDVTPKIIDGRTMVPMRAIFEAMGAKVEWDEETQTVVGTKENKKIILTIDNELAFIDGEAKTLDVPAKVVNGRTLVPVRFIAEALNCNVDWNGDTQTVIILNQTDEKDRISIIVGTSADFPPFEYMNADGEIVGFDIALIEEIAKEIGADIQIENMEFKDLVASMEAGKTNLIIAGINITEERMESVDFSVPYYDATQKIVLRKGDTSIDNKDDLAGKNIAVVEGTTGDNYVTDKIKDSKVVRFLKFGDAVTDLINKRTDAILMDCTIAEKFVKDNEDSIYAIDGNYDIEKYGIAVKKGDTKLLNIINEGLEKLKNNGVYDKLIFEYFK